MANDIAIFKAANLTKENIAKYRENIAKVAATAPTAPGTDILRLDKQGVWRYGPELTEIEPGSLWAANPASFYKGFICWAKHSKQPLDKRMANIMTGQLPSAADLPEHPGGKWSESVAFDLQCINGEDKGTTVTYTANTTGGVERWHVLVEQLGEQWERDPTKLVAVLSLDHDGYYHSNAQYGVRKDNKPGWIVKPIFKVVEWLAQDGTGETQLEAPQEEEVALQSGNGGEPPRRASTIDIAAAAAAAPDPVPDPVRRQRRRQAL